MDDTVDVWMRLEDFVEVVLFPDVDLKEVGSLAADELNSINGFFGRIEKVVCNDDFVVCFE